MPYRLLLLFTAAVFLVALSSVAGCGGDNFPPPPCPESRGGRTAPCPTSTPSPVVEEVTEPMRGAFRSGFRRSVSENATMRSYA
ncbi:MAG: hypothetical protein H8F28_00855 [Fibrella sp.]|nr:hypothetical protein [Armatimonadota bacterium]